MARFASLATVPTETRHLLRARFTQFLPPLHDAPYQPGKSATLPDEDILQIFLNLIVDSGSDRIRAQAIYATASEEAADVPNLETLIAMGWTREVWGYLHVSFDAAHTAKTAANVPDWFRSFLEQRYHDHYRVALTINPNTELEATTTAVNAGTLEPRNIPCQSPAWVAARLWDRVLPAAIDAGSALRVWVDRWSLLGFPSLTPSQVWDENAAETFRNTAINTLEHGYVTGWDAARNRYIRELATARGQDPSSYEGHISPVPTTIIDRALWLENHTLNDATYPSREANQNLSGLMRLLLADVLVTDRAPAPHPLIRRLVDLALDRPELLLALVDQAPAHPHLLADLLFCPETSALACLLIAQRPNQHGAWDAELVRRDSETAKEAAFADAVAVLGFLLQQGKIPPREVAALLTWMHASG
ncbi:MAG: hypothetical protein M0Z85_02335 [Gammaproteobacteria bacterium]|nr:hypothetical protein [Gammaproteobacteria bacterium]